MAELGKSGYDGRENKDGIDHDGHHSTHPG